MGSFDDREEMEYQGYRIIIKHKQRGVHVRAINIERPEEYYLFDRLFPFKKDAVEAIQKAIAEGNRP